MHSLKRGVFYVSDEELEKLQVEALKQGVTLSNYVRGSLGLSELRRGRTTSKHKLRTPTNVGQPIHARLGEGFTRPSFHIKPDHESRDLTVEPVYE